jgi:hypothetical protein
LCLMEMMLLELPANDGGDNLGVEGCGQADCNVDGGVVPQSRL